MSLSLIRGSSWVCHLGGPWPVSQLTKPAPKSLAPLALASRTPTHSSGSQVTVAGVPLEGPRELSAAEVAAGVSLTLAGRVGLVLHLAAPEVPREADALGMVGTSRAVAAGTAGLPLGALRLAGQHPAAAQPDAPPRHRPVLTGAQDRVPPQAHGRLRGGAARRPPRGRLGARVQGRQPRRERPGCPAPLQLRASCRLSLHGPPERARWHRYLPGSPPQARAAAAVCRSPRVLVRGCRCALPYSEPPRQDPLGPESIGRPSHASPRVHRTSALSLSLYDDTAQPKRHCRGRTGGGAPSAKLPSPGPCWRSGAFMLSTMIGSSFTTSRHDARWPLPVPLPWASDSVSWRRRRSSWER